MEDLLAGGITDSKRSMTSPSLDSRLAAREKPRTKPVMYQQWRHLLFAHWEFNPEEIQRTLPPGLRVDTFNDKAYVGVVPFFMRNIRPRFLPSVPGISNFLEMNVRTYVYDQEGRPGVWFYSLDANQWLAVQIARRFFQLPYFYARMRANDGTEISYSVARRGASTNLNSSFRYSNDGPLETPRPGSFEFFLVERYRLFSYNQQQKQLFSGQVHHSPYPLCAARAEIHAEGAFELVGLVAPKRPPEHLILSEGVDVAIYGLEKLEKAV